MSTKVYCIHWLPVSRRGTVVSCIRNYSFHGRKREFL